MIVLVLLLLAGVVYIVIREYSIKRLSDELEEVINAYMLGDFRKRIFLRHRGSLSRVVGRLNEFSEIIGTRVRELERERQRWQGLLKGLSDGVFLINEDNRVEIVNETFLQEFSLSEDDVVGKRYSEALRDSVLIELIDASRTTGYTHRGDIVVDETGRIFRATVYPVNIEDRTNIMVIFRDITERRELERLKRDFIANVSHELKTPITTIRGYVETLIDETSEKNGDTREFLEIIHKNTLRMERLVQDLIQLSAIESGVVKIEKTDVMVEEFFSELIGEFRKEAEKKGLQLKLSLDSDLKSIKADPLRLKQIFSNLIDNAIKFTERGFISLGAETRGNTVVLFVQDTGIGIPEKFIPRLGERFFRVDPSRSRALGGTGLGLAIVKHLVQAQGWRIEFISSPAKGTRVNIFTNNE
jgi:two-component system phosphate regulon sensor histidine kinase PhoR